MPDNKLVIRRLPPSMSEEDLLEQLSPLPDYDYFCFFEANPSLAPHSYSRAYINFLRAEDMATFLQKFDNHNFSDRDGHEYAAVIEQAMWHKSPKSGPFYKAPEGDTSSQSTTAEAACKTVIEEDADFVKFIEDSKLEKKRPQQSPIQNLESNTDELTNPSHVLLLGSGGGATAGAGNASGSKPNKNHVKVMTPLINYVNQQRINKGSKRSR